MGAESTQTKPGPRTHFGRNLRGGLWILGLAVLCLALAMPDLPARVESLFRTEFPITAGCDPWSGPCTATSPDGPLRVAWRPVGLNSTVHVQADATPKYRPVKAIWTGLDMNMGRTVFEFAASPGAELVEAHGVLPVCTLSQMVWRLDVVWADPEGRTSQASFTVNGGQAPSTPP